MVLGAPAVEGSGDRSRASGNGRLRPGRHSRYSAASKPSKPTMKKILLATLVVALAGCIPIGFRSSTQMIAPAFAESWLAQPPFAESSFAQPSIATQAD